MHRFLIFLLLVFASILLGVPAAWAQDDSPSEVTVPDAALRAVLEDSLGLSAGDPIMATDLAGLTVLEARDAGILDLTGLESATGLTLSLSAGQDTVQAQAEPVDSLAAKESPSSRWDLESNKGLRWLAKVAAGTGSCIVSTGMAIGFLTSTWEIPERDDPAGHNRGVGVLLYSAAIGSSVGFPLGVSSVDRHDSLPGTLLAGVIPAAAGIGMIAIDQEIDQERLGTALLLIYVAPVLSSLIVSEVWRNPPEGRGASFGLAPTFNGDFSADVTLRF